MKAIILISSIFYILGLKISNKFEVVKKVNAVEKIITHSIPSKQTEKTVYFKDESKPDCKIDSLKIANKAGNLVDDKNHF